jgi:membrane protein DedA with SNARE-associated domain
MDEYDRGMDTDVKIYFRKIMRSFTAGFLWFFVVTIMAFAFKMARVKESISWQNILFYLLSVATLAALLYYLFRTWRKDFNQHQR